MKLFLILIAFFSFQDNVPFKPSDDFQVNIDLQFKVKEQEYGPRSYSANGDRLDKPNTTPFPFLSVVISKIKIQNDEIKITASDSNGKMLFKKKASPLLELHFQMGFVDELKTKTAPNEVTIYFLSSDKKELRKIVLTITLDGIFLVNGEWHGQF